jgi:hypothetical protein
MSEAAKKYQEISVTISEHANELPTLKKLLQCHVENQAPYSKRFKDKDQNLYLKHFIIDYFHKLNSQLYRTFLTIVYLIAWLMQCRTELWFRMSKITNL